MNNKELGFSEEGLRELKGTFQELRDTAIKFLEDLAEGLCSLIDKILDFIENREQKDLTRVSWVIIYDTTRVSQFYSREPIVVVRKLM